MLRQYALKTAHNRHLKFKTAHESAHGIITYFRKNGDTNEIQYFNCGGATSTSYDQTKVLNGTNVRYQTSVGGIGIAINLDGRQFKIMSAKAGTFFIGGNIYSLSDYEVKVVSCGAADPTPASTPTGNSHEK